MIRLIRTEEKTIRTELHPTIITEPQELASLCRDLASAGWFSFDTEFVGEDRFQPEVCLIQVATEKACVLIDPLGGLDVKPFWELIADDRILVIVHAGSEDIGQCWKEIGLQPRCVFDLQIAAGLLGYGYPISLVRLARQIIGRKIHKSQTLTDWRLRPLSDEQIRYAAEDVTLLRAMYERIHKMLVERGRMEWAREECESLCQNADRTDGGAQKILRLKGSGSLKGRELAIASALISVREELAQQYNRPVRTVIGDHLVVEIARRGWTDADRIQSLRGINLKISAVKHLAQAVKTAKQLPSDQWPVQALQDDSTQEETLITLLAAVLRNHCHQKNLAFQLVGKKQSIRALVRSYTRPEEDTVSHPYQAGWRKEAVGKMLDMLLSGQSCVRVSFKGNQYGLCIESNPGSDCKS